MKNKVKVFTAKQEKIARYSKALGHPVRVFIVDFLIKNAEKGCYSGNIAKKLPIARSTLSQHLNELKTAGLIWGETNPPYIKYYINKEGWTEAKKLIRSFLKREP
jgi:ArsR family transcriptional regulator, arsenate/arsenite/antimonite-responsive transcriptional repressor